MIISAGEAWTWLEAVPGPRLDPMIALPKLAVFDMDGLMIDTETVAVRNWVKTGQAFGYDLDPAVIIAAAGTTREKTLEILADQYGGDFPCDKAFAFYSHLSDETYRTEGVAVKPGLAELLDFLDEKGVVKCVATSSARDNAAMKLARTRLTDRFAFFVCGDEVAHSKPAPDIFLQACDRGGVEPKDALVFEDSAHGLAAAVAAQIPCVVVPDLVPLTDGEKGQAAAVCQTLADAIPLFG